MWLCVIGVGYVGLVMVVCFVEMGNQVCCVECDCEWVVWLRCGEMLIYELGLESILCDQLDVVCLIFIVSLVEGLVDVEVVFIVVGMLCGEDGLVDFSYVMVVVE